MTRASSKLGNCGACEVGDYELDLVTDDSVVIAVEVVDVEVVLVIVDSEEEEEVEVETLVIEVVEVVTDGTELIAIGVP